MSNQSNMKMKLAAEITATENILNEWNSTLQMAIEQKEPRTAQLAIKKISTLTIDLIFLNAIYEDMVNQNKDKKAA